MFKKSIMQPSGVAYECWKVEKWLADPIRGRLEISMLGFFDKEAHDACASPISKSIVFEFPDSYPASSDAAEDRVRASDEFKDSKTY